MAAAGCAPASRFWLCSGKSARFWLTITAAIGSAPAWAGKSFFGRPLPPRNCTDLYLHPEHLERVRTALEEFFAHHDLLTPPDVRELFDISRKYIIPLLEYFDGIKFTVRTPEGRKMLIGGRSR